MPVAAHTPTDPNVLTNGAQCYRQCIPKGLQGAVIIWLLDQWLKKKEPVARFSYEPESTVISWTEVPGGPFSGDLATFYATATIANVQILNMAGLNLTAINNLQLLPSLVSLVCSNNLLSVLDLSGCANLQNLDCSLNYLVSLNVSGLTNLQYLTLSDNASCLTLNASGCTSLLEMHSLACSSLDDINLSNCSSLTIVECQNCNLGNLNITGCFAITTLDISNNPAVVIIGP